MKVELIAHTKFAGAYYDAWGPWMYTPYTRSTEADLRGTTDADELSEFAGRLCYRSWNRPNPATATNAGYIQNIIDHAHFSVLEHASASFYIEGTSRTLTHELVRHRLLSVSQTSQRYVDESEEGIVVPPALMELAKTDSEAKNKVFELLSLDDQAKKTYSSLHDYLSSKGLSKKEARQSARAALLGSQQTALVATANLRAWREIISKRNSPHADVEIRELARLLLGHLKGIAENAFQDMPLSEETANEISS